jgi:hypothetical protein
MPRQEQGGRLTPGDAALPGFAANAEILETDFLGAVQRIRRHPNTSEVPVD